MHQWGATRLQIYMLYGLHSALLLFPPAKVRNSNFLASSLSISLSFSLFLVPFF